MAEQSTDLRAGAASEGELAGKPRDANGPVSILGTGRAARAFLRGFRDAGIAVDGPWGRGDTPLTSGVILLCVPERELPSAMSRVPSTAIVGHCSASEPLDTLMPNRRFALHPLMTLIGETTSLRGAYCAIDGSDSTATDVAMALATRLGMTPMRVPADQRALYHAAASIASNYLVTLEWAAERAAARCGVPRGALAPLVQATVDAWRSRGFPGAITGPVARGDIATVARQRDAIATTAPELLILFDAMAHTTRLALQDSPPITPGAPVRPAPPSSPTATPSPTGA